MLGTISYSEQYQRALFAAARQVRKIAAEVLNDVQNNVELTSESTHQWVRQTAKHYADKARELELAGHEVCISSGHSDAANNRSHATYGAAIDAYEARRAAAQGRAA